MRRNKLVAGGDDGDPGFSEDGDVSDAKREQAADVLGAYRVPGAEQEVSGSDILARVYNVLARRHRAQNLDRCVVSGLSALDHHHGVGVFGEHSARVGDRGLADAQGNIGAGAGGDVGDYFQHGGQAFGRAECVAGADGEAVHGGLWERGQFFRGADFVGYHATERGRCGYGFTLAYGGNVGEQVLEGLAGERTLKNSGIFFPSVGAIVSTSDYRVWRI